MVDMRTRYMGLELSHPVVASASPLSKDLDGIRRLEDAGASAIVMFSLFEEQIRQESAAVERLLQAGTESFAESVSYFPDAGALDVGPDRYLELVSRARQAVDVPVIASLNGTTREGWIDYAHLVEEAGASAIELNVYQMTTDPDVTSADVETRTVELVRAIKGAVSLPVAVKLGPFYSAFANLAARLDAAGADALVLFNRFYQPDFDLERREIVPSLELSAPHETRLPLLWLGVLAGRVRCSLAATTGIHAPEGVVKVLMAGADVAMSTSAVLLHGPGHLNVLADGARTWLERHGYASVAELRGSMSQRKAADAGAFERANYIRVISSYEPHDAR
jgi:dihydroorotate dehydrogenase (fumarate)